MLSMSDLSIPSADDLIFPFQEQTNMGGSESKEHPDLQPCKNTLPGEINP